MPRIQVVYASRHGGTQGIAQAIGKALQESGTEAVVVDAATHPNATGFDGYVIGSGVYIYHVDAPGAGSTFGRMVVFMEKERLNNF